MTQPDGSAAQVGGDQFGGEHTTQIQPAPFSMPTVQNPVAASTGTPASTPLEPRQSNEVEITRINLGSAARVSGAISVIIGLIWIIAALLIFGLFAAIGAWGNMNSVLTDITDTSISAGFVVMLIIVLAVFEAIVGTLLGVVGALIYNGLAKLGYVRGLLISVKSNK